MNPSRKFLLLILVTQVLVLALAFLGFGRRMERSLLEREAGIFDVTTNLQYSELLGDPANSAFAAMIKTARHISRMPGIMGVCLYNEKGQGLLCVPDWLPVPGEASFADGPVALYPGRLAPEFDGPGDATRLGQSLQIDIPLLGVQGQPVAYIRFFREADSFARALRSQNVRLLALALLAISLATGLTTFVFLAYDRRLQRKEGILRATNEQLLDTQRHLLLSGQLTAVGSMTAHLVHDLKTFSDRIRLMLGEMCRQGGEEDAGIRQAADCAREMDQHIRQFLGFLRSDDARFQSTFTSGELLSIIAGQVRPVAEKGGLALEVRDEADAFSIDFKQGNLLILILQNLLHNAIEATPSGGRVRLDVSRLDQQADFRVIDQGPGIPKGDQRSMFVPHKSFKKGGTGLGLAISAQMAYHIGADIALEDSGPSGSVFKVSLPVRSLSREESTLS